MRHIPASMVIAALALAVQAAELPHSASANVAVDLQRALAAAH
jgi:hypothetical protein